MSTCTLYLIPYECGIDRTKNPLFDGFASPSALLEWLAAVPDLMVIENFQYQKINSIDFSFKVNISQEVRNSNFAFSYGCIIQDGFYYFFYIDSTRWISQNTVAFDVSLDVLNTYYPNFKNAFGNRTHITRRHKPRFANNALIVGGRERLERIVDPVSEGIFPELKLNAEQEILDAFNGKKWYLIYETREDLSATNITNPIKCKLVPDEELTLADASLAEPKTFYFSEMESGTGYYVIFNEEGNSSGLYLTGTFDTDPTQATTPVDNISVGLPSYVAAYYAPSDDLTYVDILGVSQDGTRTFIARALDEKFKDGSEGALPIQTIHYGAHPGAIPTPASLIRTYPYFYVNSLGFNVYAKVMPFSGIDRTNARTMKIIELPYCPDSGFELDSNDRITFDSDAWTFKNGVFEQNYIQQAEFLNDDVASVESDLLLTISQSDLVTTKNRFILDSKMYHKDFYLYNFVYDSFIHNVQFENMAHNSSFASSPTIYISFKASNAMSSRFAFRFETDSSHPIKQTENFGQYLLVTRNNEIPIFTNSYVDYIRNGYNYDLKQRQAERTANLVGFGLSTASAAMTAIASGGAGAAGSAISFAQSLNNLIYNETSANNSLDQKLTSLSRQKTSVAGADDLDLLKYYSNNSLWLKIYKPSDMVTTMLDDYFYFYGYSTNEYGAPDLHTRVWFDYIVCEPDFSANISPIWQDYKEYIAGKFAEGVTVYHKVGNNMDLNQTKENWERFLIE